MVYFPNHNNVQFCSSSWYASNIQNYLIIHLLICTWNNTCSPNKAISYYKHPHKPCENVNIIVLQTSPVQAFHQIICSVHPFLNATMVCTGMSSYIMCISSSFSMWSLLSLGCWVMAFYTMNVIYIILHGSAWLAFESWCIVESISEGSSRCTFMWFSSSFSHGWVQSWLSSLLSKVVSIVKVLFMWRTDRC